MRIVTAGCELVYLELGDHREARLQSNGTGDVVNFSHLSDLRGGQKSNIDTEKLRQVWRMPDWDLRKACESDPQPARRHLTPTRWPLSAQAKLYVRPPKYRARHCRML